MVNSVALLVNSVNITIFTHYNGSKYSYEYYFGKQFTFQRWGILYTPYGIENYAADGHGDELYNSQLQLARSCEEAKRFAYLNGCVGCKLADEYGLNINKDSDFQFLKSCDKVIIGKTYWKSVGLMQSWPLKPQPPLEFVFQEQSYSSLHSRWSLAWDHFLGDIDDPCGIIANFCGVIRVNRLQSCKTLEEELFTSTVNDLQFL